MSEPLHPNQWPFMSQKLLIMKCRKALILYRMKSALLFIINNEIIFRFWDSVLYIPTNDLSSLNEWAATS
jgi:hypothetical protein